MDKKRLFISALVFAVLAGLVYWQIRTWRKFDWQAFASATRGIDLRLIFLGVALIYLDYVLRALRWRILLRPVKQTTTARLVAPTVIGFTGMALFGRPGELIRPLLIARKEGITMSSQMGVWIVERIFDMGAFALIMAVNIFVAADSLKMLPGFRQIPGAHQTDTFLKFKIAGAVLLAGVGVAAWIAFLVRRLPGKAAATVERLLTPISPRFARSMGHKIHAFGEGLHTIPDMKSFLQLTAVSVTIWLIIGVTYVSVTHAFRDPDLSGMTLSNVLLLTFASVIGGVLQLPVVGGGSQLATIGTLKGIFGIAPEVATSCGIMLWLVTFMSVIPAGLLLAHREHVSLIKVEEESIEEEENLEA